MVPLTRHREIREKLAAAQTELKRAEFQRDQLMVKLKQLGDQLGPLTQQMAQTFGENRVLKAMLVRIYQQATEAGVDLPKLETFQSVPEQMRDSSGSDSTG
jgi:septal ring factor EnvC (AmiA/AmiB activator)